MNKEKKRNQENDINLMDVVPVTIVESVTTDDGLVTLLRPKFRNKFLKTYLLPRMKNPNYKINLDEFGSFVWQQCDGERTVLNIAEELKTQFGEKIEPVYERLGIFIRQLESNKLIRYEYI